MQKRRSTLRKDPFHTGDKLKQLRQNKKCKQEFVATQLGVKPNTLSNYETGTILPPREVLEKAAALFNVDIREFFSTERFTLNFHGPTTASGYIENQHLDSKEVLDLMRTMMERMHEQWQRGEERMETLLRTVISSIHLNKARRS